MFLFMLSFYLFFFFNFIFYIVEESEDDFIDGLDDCLDQFENENSRSDEGPGLTQIRCGAHTQQLAIEDAFKRENRSSVIDLARNVMIKLRTPNVLALLKAMQLPSPILDCPTR